MQKPSGGAGGVRGDSDDAGRPAVGSSAASRPGSQGEGAAGGAGRGDPSSAAVELRGVRKAYVEPDGSVLPVLDIERFVLARGEQVVLLGASGCGKTTLLNVISGITSADAGQVRVDGVDLARLPEAARDRFRADRIGMVFQTFNLLPAFTALENVLLGMSFSGRRADVREARRLLERVGLGRRLEHRPGQLSVGEQQRVAVARALVKRPAVLLADEPTASVDVANQQRILDLLRDVCREHDVALLLVTHSPEVAAQFERVERLESFNRAVAPAGATR
ncbi:MAG: ABC transporter ATP-binding protein [Planctomycetota bacterium]|nr:MAG: ABC transporter ATP-binding protein [Planctomycetota bacterium]